MSDAAGTSTRGDGVDWMIVFLLALSGVLLFSNLQSGYLWQDEAETALLARNTLAFGYPRGFDGRNYIDVVPYGYGPGEAWVYSPWLPFYLLAGVFAVAGESTWVARWTFAVFGWLSVYMTWRLVRRLTSDRRVQRLSVALLTLSVPFLLHMRQCRYYALTTALILAICLAYLRLLAAASMRRVLLLGLLLILLFHTNFGIFVPVCGAIATHQVWWGGRAVWGRLLVVAGVVGAATIPWALIFFPPELAGSMSLERVRHHLEYYVRMTNKYFIPLVAVILSLVIWRMARWRARPTRHALPRSICWFLGLLVVFYVVFLLVPDQRHMRYLIPMLPVLVVGEALWLVAWMDRSRSIGWGLVVLALFTNVLQSPHVKIPLAEFAYELTHRYEGPMEGIVSYLRGHAGPEDIVKIPYDDRTLMFYTRLRVERPTRFAQDTEADWVVIRRDWIPADYFQGEYFRRIERTHDRIELEAPDILWQNREDPGSHHFQTIRDAPHVVIYHRRGRERAFQSGEPFRGV